MGITYNIRKSYLEIRANLNSGDIIQFSGEGLISRLIRIFSSKSHIGMIVKTQWGQLFVLESDWGKDFKGVQLTPLGEKIRAYKGRVFIRRLRCWRNSAWHQVLNFHIGECRRTSYEKGLGGLIELLAAELDFWPFKNRENEKRLFCSEFIAKIFKAWHYLPSSRPSNEYTPGDFDEGGPVDECMKQGMVNAELMGTIKVIK